ncbi:MAG: tRNA (N6-isopentenyl adenosine(37)-C2)-methylthiotransferase MiaB [Planctomycetes bacterium]|nr:tRNA (N6-isopentenyl adenosine(37)-C2)-methylthiotransferase MiaB [Planctomycetota bacterium]
MNKLDSELMLEQFLSKGHKQTDTEKDADVILFNTCSVRKHAEDKVYDNLRMLKPLKDKNPRLIIGLVGCMAEKEKANALDKIPFLDIVCGPNQEEAISDTIDEIIQTRSRIIKTGDGESAGKSPIRTLGSLSAYVLAMKGCNNFCSYCVVPYVRGKETSRPLGEIVNEAKMLSEKGAKEIILLGQCISSYADRGSKLSHLLKAVHEMVRIKRIRFVTSHPAYTTEDIFKAIKDLPKVCPHLHMPAQSGSDKILKAMNRKYTRGDYLKLAEKARGIVPGIEIASDFIVGFPGETEADFEDTASLIREVGFLNSFVFKYSSRPGTAADKMADDVPYKVKQERNKILLDIQGKISEEKNRLLVGKEVEILAEGRSKTNVMTQTGRTMQNHIVIFNSTDDLTGQLVKIKITSSTALSLRGELT